MTSVAHNNEPLVVLRTYSRLGYDIGMPLEVARLFLGMLIAAFHAPIADFFIKREDSLILAFRERGISLPTALPKKTAQNIYFGFGILIALIQLLRIHQLLG